MSNEVLSGANKIYIKLVNGSGIDLNALNNLVDKECNDSLFLNWEAKNGDGNSIFNQEEVKLLKEQLYSKYINDQQLSQDDLDEIFGKNDNGESYVNDSTLHQSFMKLSGEKPSLELQDDSVPENDTEPTEPVNELPVETNPVTDEEDDAAPKAPVKTEYIIQQGDTPEKIIKKLELEGEEAQKVLEELKQALGNRRFFLIAEVVTLSGDYQEKIAKLSGYKTSKDELENDYRKDQARKAALKADAENTNPQTPTLPFNVQDYVNRLKNKNINYKLNLNGDGTFTIIQKSGFNNPDVTEIVRTYDKTGTLTSHTQSYKNGNVRTFQYDKNGKGTVQTLINNNGGVFIGFPDAQGKITSMKKIFQFKDNKSSVFVMKHSDGSFDIIEKRADFASEGTSSKKYSFDNTGKHVKTTKYVKQKQKAETKPIKPFWENVKQKEPWQPNPITAGDETTTSQTNKPQETAPAKQAAPEDEQKSQPKLQQQKSLSQASLIPGLENIGTNPLAPKNKSDLARYLNADELKYPEKMRLCIAELRAARIECKIQYKDNHENYIAVIDDKNCTLFGYGENRFGKTVIVFDKDGNLIQSRRNEFGIEQDTVTTYSDGKVTDRRLQKSEPLKQVNGKTGIPYAVERELEKIKLNSKSTEVVKNADSTFSFVCVPNNAINKFNSSKIEYVYNWEGKQLYQLHYSSTDESVKIGRFNKKTNEIEFKDFKDANGIIINIPDNVMQKYHEMQQCGGKAKIEKDKDFITITQTASQYMGQNNIAKIVTTFDAFGKKLTEDFTLTNGRVVRNYDLASNGNDPAHTPNPIIIDFTHAPQYKGEDTKFNQNLIYGLKTKGPKETAQKFAKSLTDSKGHFMKSLNLTNEEYDNLAILAMGIAEQETHFGAEIYVETDLETKHTQYRAIGKNIGGAVWDIESLVTGEEERASHSQGITQINFNLAMSDPIIKKRLNAEGIYSFKDFDGSIENQTKATMIILSRYKAIAEGEVWQKRLQKNNAKIKDPDERLTTNDVIALLWNGASGVAKRIDSGEIITINTGSKTIKTGNIVTRQVSSIPGGTPIYQNVEETCTLKGAQYAKNVRAYASKFFAIPPTKSPAPMHTTQHINPVGALGAQTLNNGGSIGEVIFMPTTYDNKWRVKSPQSKDKLKELINANSQLSQDNKDKLIEYIENDIINFGNQGLTVNEANSITDANVELMKEIVEQINTKKLTPRDANLEFERKYLASQSFTVRYKDVPETSILKATASSNPEDKRFFYHEFKFELPEAYYANGKIKRHKANYNTLGDNDCTVFAVTRSPGVNPTLSNGKLVRTEDSLAAEYSVYTATYLIESGGHCIFGEKVNIELTYGIDRRKIRGKNNRSLSKGKEMIEFYEKFDKLFEQVKYIDNGNGTCDELNASHTDKIPCGYKVTYIPGPGFDGTPAYEGQDPKNIQNLEGHTGTADGFGGVNADEHDNGRWAHFGNGKGEHGKMIVYRTKDNAVSVVPADDPNNKLGRAVCVPLDINPWYLIPEVRELQKIEREKLGLPPLEVIEEFPVD